MQVALAVLVPAAILFALHAVWRVRFGLPPRNIPRVLCFHKLSRRFLFEGTWTTPTRFAAMMDRLRERGYTFIDEAQYLASLAGPREDRSKQIFLTFDDGYTEVHDIAWPMLQERGIPFHVFLVTEYAGRTNDWDLSLGRPPFRHMDWEMVREMSAGGVTFGSHTCAHADLTRATREETLADLVRSKRSIEEVTGKPARTLSYPFGRYNDVAEDAARVAGFEAAFSLYPRHRNAITNRFALRRDAVYIIDPVSAIEIKLGKHPLCGIEEMKCRAINAVAVLTPLLKPR